VSSDYVTLNEGGYIDSMELGGQMVNVNGYNVIPQQSALNLNQPLFLRVSTGEWCKLAGAGAAGLILQGLDGKYTFGVDATDLANVGIQA
jgi:hypothetical protein